MTTEVFICKVAYKGLSLTCADFNAGLPGYEDFVRCDFRTEDYEAALNHVDAACGGRLGCWVESHSYGNRNKPVMREMHGSDFGGVYVQDYRLRPGLPVWGRKP